MVICRGWCRSTKHVEHNAQLITWLVDAQEQSWNRTKWQDISDRLYSSCWAVQEQCHQKPRLQLLCSCDNRIKLLPVFVLEIFGEWLAGIFNQLTAATVRTTITIFSPYVDYTPHFMTSIILQGVQEK